MKLTAGQALASAVDTTSVIVIRAPTVEVSVTCGGPEMIDGKTTSELIDADLSQQAGTQIGKRYADLGLGLELLCTKPGTGTLAVNGAPLALKEAKPLPASD
jgi:hypothetical protein